MRLLPDNDAEKPPEPEPEEDLGDYELAIELPEETSPRTHLVPEPLALGPSPGRCPNCGSKINPDVVVCLNCGYHLRERARIETQVHAAPADGDDQAAIPAGPARAIDSAREIALAALSGKRAGKGRDARDANRDFMMREIYIPLFIAAVGLLVMLATACLLMPVRVAAPVPSPIAAAITAMGAAGNPSSPGLTLAAPPTMAAPPPPPSPEIQRLAALFDQAVLIVVQLPFLLLGLFVIAYLYGSSFGPLVTGMLKLVALAVAANAISFLTRSALLVMTDGSFEMGVSIVEYFVGYAAFWALAAYLFEMSHREARFLYLFTVFMPVLVILGFEFLMA